MNSALHVTDSTAGTSNLRAALEGVLNRYFGVPRTIVALQRQTYPYHSSFALEELDVQLDNNTYLELVFKDTSALLASARQVKPDFLFNPWREIETYRTILTPNPMGTAQFYGAVVEPYIGRYWLFLEKVKGLELYQVEFALWQQVARWLAEMHTRFASQTAALTRRVPLIQYDTDYYWRWIRRAQIFLKENENARGLDWLAQGYARVVNRLTQLPRTFIHGEFYASNVLVPKNQNELRVAPVDWEMAAIGPGLVDLAALTAGSWSDEERRELALAYYAALDNPHHGFSSTDEFLDALDYCRLHIAVQWLGWSPRWSPPVEHAQDWLGEAASLAEKLGLP